jgi:hypothetical protein
VILSVSTINSEELVIVAISTSVNVSNPEETRIAQNKRQDDLVQYPIERQGLVAVLTSAKTNASKPDETRCPQRTERLGVIYIEIEPSDISLLDERRRLHRHSR